MKSVLQIVKPIVISSDGMMASVIDETFSDLEDRFQYQCALENRCKAIVTINNKHFINANKRIEVLTPTQFMEKYIQYN